MNETLTNIMNTDEANTILAVSHGGALYMFYNYGYHLKKLKEVKFSNCCILEFEFEKNAFKFIQAINPTEMA